jgi:hypothetical protein
MKKSKPSVMYCVKCKSYVLGKPDWYRQAPTKSKIYHIRGKYNTRTIPEWLESYMLVKCRSLGYYEAVCKRLCIY